MNELQIALAILLSISITIRVDKLIDWNWIFVFWYYHLLYRPFWIMDTIGVLMSLWLFGLVFYSGYKLFKHRIPIEEFLIIVWKFYGSSLLSFDSLILVFIIIKYLETDDYDISLFILLISINIFTYLLLSLFLYSKLSTM